MRGSYEGQYRATAQTAQVDVNLRRFDCIADVKWRQAGVGLFVA